MIRKTQNRLKKDQAPKLGLGDYMQLKIREVKKAFLAPMKVTLIVRHPTDDDAELVFSDDDFDAVIAMMQRRRDAVVAAQKPQAFGVQP